MWRLRRSKTKTDLAFALLCRDGAVGVNSSGSNQVKQRKKSSNKWSCVICKKKQCVYLQVQKEVCWNFKQFFRFGGMPSSHSATVSSVAVPIGLQDPSGGPLFATSMILTCVLIDIFITTLASFRCVDYK